MSEQSKSSESSYTVEPGNTGISHTLETWEVGEATGEQRGQEVLTGLYSLAEASKQNSVESGQGIQQDLLPDIKTERSRLTKELRAIIKDNPEAISGLLRTVADERIKRGVANGLSPEESLYPHKNPTLGHENIVINEFTEIIGHGDPKVEIEDSAVSVFEAAHSELPEETVASQSVPEADPTPNFEGPMLEELTRLFTWGDVLTAQQQKQVAESIENPENAANYFDTFKQLVAEHGLPELKNRARLMVELSTQQLQQLGTEPSVFGRSVTWALWDIAKQRYYFDHPEKRDPNYEAADPMTSHEKMDEIVDRHVGWETYGFLNSLSGKERESRLSNHPNAAKILEYVSRTPKPQNGTLSSKELAELGKLLRMPETNP